MQQMDIKQWVEASIKLMEKTKSIPFGITGPLTEVLLIVNLAIRGHDIQKEVSDEIEYPDSSVIIMG
jgi:hypothetical protein